MEGNFLATVHFYPSCRQKKLAKVLDMASTTIDLTFEDKIICNRQSDFMIIVN